MGIFSRFSLVLYALMKKLDCGIKVWTLSMKTSHLVENTVLTGMVKVSSAVGADTMEIQAPQLSTFMIFKLNSLSIDLTIYVMMFDCSVFKLEFLIVLHLIKHFFPEIHRQLCALYSVVQSPFKHIFKVHIRPETIIIK